MPEEIKDKIFGIFFTTKDKETGEGLGLGLHIARWIVEDCHRGKIEIESKNGAFTRFKMFLPDDGGVV